MIRALEKIKGISLCIFIALLADFAVFYLPFDSVTLAIIIGICASNLFKLSSDFNSGIDFSEKKLLSLAIVLMGINLNFLLLKEIGFALFFWILLSLLFTVLVTFLLGSFFGLRRRFALLLGVGSAICGSSAILASKEIIKASPEETATSVTSVNLLGSAGLFILPLLAFFLPESGAIENGYLIGNTLQSVGHVMAAGFSVDESSAQIAIIVKMTRVLLLTPVLVILFFSASKVYGKSASGKVQGFPLFILGFILFSLIPTFSILDEETISLVSKAAKYILLVAMAALGLKINIGSLLSAGTKGLITASLVFVFQILFSGAVILFALN